MTKTQIKLCNSLTVPRYILLKMPYLMYADASIFGERFSLQLVTTYPEVIPFVSYIGVYSKRYGFLTSFGLIKTDQPIRVLPLPKPSFCPK